MKWYHKFFCSCMVHRSVCRGRRRPNKTSSRNRARGVTIVWVAFLLFAIVLVVGFGLDGARLYMDAHQLQNAADAAALAGAQYVKVGYLAGMDPDPTNDYDYPAVVFRIAQEFAKQHKACLAPVNLNVPDLSAFDEFDPYDPETVDVVIGYYHRQNPYASHVFSRYAVEQFMMLQQLQVFTPYNPDDPDAKVPNAVAVVAQQTAASAANDPVPLFFGRIVGVNSANVQRLAIAISVGSGGSGLIALDPDGVGLQFDGTPQLIVVGTEPGIEAGIQVNSEWDRDGENKYAVEPGGQKAVVVCDEMNVCGLTNPSFYDESWDFPLNEGPSVPAVQDPLAALPDLNPGLMPAQTETYKNKTIYSSTITTDGFAEIGVDESGNPILVIDPVTEEPFWTLTLSPGYYPGGFRLTSQAITAPLIDPATGEPVTEIRPIYDANGILVGEKEVVVNQKYLPKLQLQPGIYALGGGAGGQPTGLFVNGGAFVAEGVMLYITESDTGKWGEVNLEGEKAVIMISEYKYLAGDPEEYKAYSYTGIAVFQDRNNTEEAKIVGGSDSHFGGTLYFHSHDFDTVTRVGGNSEDCGIQLITDNVIVHGTGTIRINYDGRNWNAAFMSLLVE